MTRASLLFEKLISSHMTRASLLFEKIRLEPWHGLEPHYYHYKSWGSSHDGLEPHYYY